MSAGVAHVNYTGIIWGGSGKSLYPFMTVGIMQNPFVSVMAEGQNIPFGADYRKLFRKTRAPTARIHHSESLDKLCSLLFYSPLHRIYAYSIMLLKLS